MASRLTRKEVLLWKAYLRQLSCYLESHYFDAQIITHINSVFMILTQLGVGPPEGFIINDKSNTWNEFIPDGKNLELVKSYVHLKVRTLFDPPSSSVVMESTNRMINEFEWRLNAAAESNAQEVNKK